MPGVTALTDARLHEWRALCVGPDGADLRAVILTERRTAVAVLDELARVRRALAKIKAVRNRNDGTPIRLQADEMYDIAHGALNAG